MDVVGLAKHTVNDWLDDEAARLAAALAFYTLLSLAPMLVLAVSLAGLFFGDEAARGQVARELSEVVGPQAAVGLQAVVESARAPEAGTFGTLLGIVTLFVGASGVFGELQASLNHIWEVKAHYAGLLGMLKERFFSFAMVLAVAFLLLVSLLLSAALSAVGTLVADRLPGGAVLWHAANLVLSFAITGLLFALVFKIIPDVRLAFRHVWVGALVTAFLFTVGKSLLGLYLGTSSLTSSYGAAGSLVALVVWVYYSAQILFLGAEFTQVYARARGVRTAPRRGAVSVPRRFQPDLQERDNLSRRDGDATHTDLVGSHELP